MQVNYANELIAAGTSPNTLRAHSGDEKYFWAWARRRFGMNKSYPVAVDVMVKFITDHLVQMPQAVEDSLVKAGIKRGYGPHTPATVERRLSSLRAIHNREGFEYGDNPCTSTEVKVLMRKAKAAMARSGHGPDRKRAIDKQLLDRMLATFTMREKDKRDMAILLFAFATGGRRRSEVAAARMEDLTVVRGGYIYRMPLSKNDQTGKGYTLPVRGAAAEALRLWLRVGDIHDGYIFRAIRRGEITKDPITPSTVAAIVKERVERCGLDPKSYGAHSLRSGFLTECGRRGVSLRDTMQMSTHKDVRTAIIYHQEGEIWKNPASKLV